MIRVHQSLPPLPIRLEAWQWLKQYGVTLAVRDPHSTTGGGFWHPDHRHVELFTAQEEAAIHEIAHAWWEERRKDDATRLSFLEAVIRLSKETDPRYKDAAGLAYVYEHGDPSTGFPGMFDNDWERYAGLASGTMGRPERLPDYIRHFYEGLFD
jgi:hypothetical protein